MRKLFIHTVTIIHIPITIIRVLVSTVILIDAWCDSVIDRRL